MGGPRHELARGGFHGLVARRLVRRRGSAPRWARQLGLSAGIVLGLGCVCVLLGWRGPAVIACTWLACVACMFAVLVAQLRAMLVVAVGGLALGVASLFVVLGVASGIEAKLIDSLARLNGHAMINKYGLDFEEYEELSAKLEADARVDAAVPFVFGVGALVRVGSGELPVSGPEAPGSERGQSPVIVSIKGVDPRALADFSAAAELFSSGGLEALRPAGPRALPGIVLGHRLARRLDAREGDRMRLVVPASISGDKYDADPAPRHAEFEVLGLLDTGFAEFDASFVLVHLTAAQALVYGQARVSGIELELADVRLAEVMTTARSLVDALNAPRVAAKQLPLYRTGSWLQRSATLTSIRQMKAALALVLSLIILVASGSLLGALLLLLRHERRNIGVLAAMGARPRQLFWLFESIGIGIGLLGALLGLGLGSLSLGALSLLQFRLDPSIYMVDRLPVAFMLTDVLMPCGVALVVCALATGPAAARVARVKPTALL